ncbi:glycosyltransferase, putative [Trypanosoma brucei gambiense DAL972]|uniref:Glycosyltransferase, putative n=2 Tax=Trypanosoma brucei TaxID=5691 RepID=C9ZZT9_TRYB9|nr:glycosyltransferase, putative [Trypanosoma brucei gambiense DAL972]RHW69936.1 dolichyl-P-Man:GDP-ManGlcNAc2-PP-dolichyl beta-1 [Trypanosoma brucei equiperdum]CBH16497.1 glycosyltransferase, putative [Trypanosoma brucei gambiense DAL972]|eukprot:XP_011778761.1 glycosyltransferase, putative [Trypanosoma brucei gambiense DAL972]
MFSYDDLVWTISFPTFCFLAIWFSITVSLVVRAESGRKKWKQAREHIAEIESRGDKATGAQHRNSKAVLRRVVVVVGGDFARSPRMQYHALSLAKCGMFQEVVLVGFDMGNRLSEELKLREKKKNIDGSYDDSSVEKFECVVETAYLIPPITPPLWFRILFPHPKLHWLASTFYRACACAVVFTWVLVRASMMFVNSRGQLMLVDLILMQSPPAVPFVPVVKYIVQPCAFVANAVTYYCIILTGSWLSTALKEITEGIKLQRQRQLPVEKNPMKKDPTNSNSCPKFVLSPALVVDWHNFGYTVLRNDGRPAVAVWLYRLLECNLCFGDRNITVSKAMRRALLDVSKQSKVANRVDDVWVMYDSAPSFFGLVPRSRFVQEVIRPVMSAHSQDGEEVIGCSLPPDWVLQSTAATDSRGIFIVASTSWTPDDDYTMVVEALKQVDEKLQECSQGKDSKPTAAKSVWLLVTGKGVARKRFEMAVAEAHLSSLVVVTTMYMQSYKHYAMALGAADVGLCMHNSSSGLDLPMKAVDMLGSGLPVVALRYKSLHELLDDKRGWFFSNAEELGQVMWKQLILTNGPLLEKRRQVAQNGPGTWDENWGEVLMPLLTNLL